MKKLGTFLFCLQALSVWAAPNFADIDSWQLPPEQKNAPQAEPQKAPAAKRSTKRRTSTKEAKPVLIEMTASGMYKSARNTRDPNEISIMDKSAEELTKQLVNRGRFSIIFNADIPADLDTMIDGTNDRRFALVRFGKPEGPYRKFLFVGGGNQPLLTVVENLDGALDAYLKYGASMEVTEQDVAKAYAGVTPVPLIHAETKEEYHAYALPQNRYFVFKNGEIVNAFTDQTAYNTYTKELTTPKPKETPQKKKKSTVKKSKRSSGSINTSRPWQNSTNRPGVGRKFPSKR